MQKVYGRGVLETLAFFQQQTANVQALAVGLFGNIADRKRLASRVDGMYLWGWLGCKMARTRAGRQIALYGITKMGVAAIGGETARLTAFVQARAGKTAQDLILEHLLAERTACLHSLDRDVFFDLANRDALQHILDAMARQGIIGFRHGSYAIWPSVRDRLEAERAQA